MVLDELWDALSGPSGATLACCLVAAALALRWSSHRTARGAAARARQKQQEALETMDKAAQRFRLQVMAGVGIGVRGRAWGGGSTFSRPAARRGERRAAGSGQRRCVGSAGS